jgi:Di- and tricarboxylate transporters
MLFMVPLVIVLILVSWMLLKRIFPFSQKTIELKIEGEMKKDRKSTLVIITMIITILLWMMDALTGINTYTVALIPFAVFAMAGIVTKYDLEEINWSVLWMVAGGFALGYAMNGSGLAALVVRAIPFGNFSPLLIVVLSGLLCYGLSNLISHSATAALLMPILVVVCTAMGDKLTAIGGTSTVLIGVAIAASSAMVLPISTPPNALAYATGLVQQKDMARMGVIVGVISIVLGYLVLFAAGSLHIV